MVPDKDFVLAALLQKNFFPTQKDDKSDIPPILDSGTFSVSAARKLEAIRNRRSPGYAGYDAVDYRLTRFNGVTRVCSIPHPKAYASLAVRIAGSWNKLKAIANNPVSKVIPRQHDDGRLFIMSYGSGGVSEVEEMLSSSFGRRYIVRTDISNFFSSIYSHAVPWALVGFDEAKQNITKHSKWYNRLDKAIQSTKRNETNGIAVGPGTSAVVAEIILAEVDSSVSQEFTYFRYIDDYTAYCNSTDECEAFVLTLAEELAKYKLALNSGKTIVQPLPQGSKPDWIIDIRNSLPRRGNMSAYSVSDYLDNVLRVSENFPDGSVLKYGLKTLVRTIFERFPRTEMRTIRLVLHSTLNLCFYRPALIPLLDSLLSRVLPWDGTYAYEDHFHRLLREHVRMRRTDAITWFLYYYIKYNVPVNDADACLIVRSEDCIPMLLLYQTGNATHQQWVIDFANSLDLNDLYRLDRYWLLLYQLFLEGRISNPYDNPKSGGAAFELMKNEGLNFIVPP